MAKSKQSSTSPLSLLGIAFIGYLAIKHLGGAASSAISFGRPRIRFGGIQNWGVETTITIPVTNQNPVGLTIDGLLGQLKYGQYTLLPFQMANQVHIAANATTEVTFNGQIRFAEIGGNILALFTSGQIMQDLRIQGQAYVAGLTIPFNSSIGL
ncbi:MAG: LEA type 2 family protein [Bacteroidota bacterium]